jgi:ubiquinone/menaquinone biosynthesis C-methylase UbiE
MENNIFDSSELLIAYDKIMLCGKHYKKVIKIHLHELNYAKDILDVGCGTGNLTLQFIRKDRKVTGVDVSGPSLAKLRIKSKSSKNLKLVKMDLSKGIVFEKRFDGISSMMTSHLVPNIEKHYLDCYNSLSSGGKFVVTARTKRGDPERLVRSIRSCLVHAHLYKKLKKEFDIISNQMLRTAKSRSSSLINEDEAIKIFKKIGFVNIKSIKNNTLGTMYTLVGEKQ